MYCVCCKSDKDETEFNWKNKAQQLRKNYCRLCDRAIKKRFYQRHKQQVISEVSQRKQEITERFKQLKSDRGCFICYEKDPCCLDFHHLDPSEKDFTISGALNRRSLKLIEKEIEKCIVVCRNCHAKIHQYGIENIKRGWPIG